MPVNNTRQLDSTRDDTLITGFAALAICIHIAESALPSPLPGIKPGLANIITLYVLLSYGWRMAAWVSLLRVLGASLLLGTFLSPTFMLSLAGGLSSLGVLWLATHIPGRPFGPVGYSILAALAHMSAQFFTAYTLFMPHPALLNLLPVLLTTALLSGIFGGIITHTVMQQLRASRT